MSAPKLPGLGQRCGGMLDPMTDLRSARTTCPSCGEALELLVDPSIPSQEYVEDCEVCCRPMVVTVHLDSGDSMVTVVSEDQ